jgi:small GTP-binding protein
MTAPTLYLSVLDGEIATLRQEEVELISDIAQAIIGDSGTAQADRQKLRDIAQDLREMFFLVVVIGEFNAGKSSFINAILGYKLLETGITPTTEYIELVRYNEIPQSSPTLREDGIREWAHPNTGAQGVAIVDTPGTGSIFMKHEKTAKDFLHRSDLVIFLFSAKQAFAESERLYLELAKNYGKKVILVINQVDLLSAQEQSQVLNFVRSKVKETLSIEPPIFMVSAKEAMATIPDDGGNIGAVKAHLRGVYSEALPAKQKLLAEITTAERIMRSHVETAHEKTSLVTLNFSKVKGIEGEMDSQSVGLDTRQREVSQNITKVLEGIRSRGMTFIDSNFNVFRFSNGKSQEDLQKEFQEVVVGRSMRDINELANGYINTVIDQSRLYWNSVIERLNKLQDLLEQKKGGYDAGVYAEQRENLEEAIRIAETEMQNNTSDKMLSDLATTFKGYDTTFKRGSLVSLGGIVAIAIAAPGGLIAAPAIGLAILGSIFTVGGGIPAIRAFLKATNGAKSDLNQRIDALIQRYNEALEELTRKERNRLSQYGKQQLVPIFSRLEALSKEYADKQSELEAYTRQIEALKRRIDALE